MKCAEPWSWKRPGAIFAIVIALVAFQAQHAAGEPPQGPSCDFSISLGYHSRPLDTREWRIMVCRKGEGAKIVIENFRSRNLSAPLPRERYVALVERFNRLGIWRLEDYCPPQSRNAFYRVEVADSRYRHAFRVEAGPVLSGRGARYLEIIRTLTNLAIMSIEE